MTKEVPDQIVLEVAKSTDSAKNFSQVGEISTPLLSQTFGADPCMRKSRYQTNHNLWSPVSANGEVTEACSGMVLNSKLDP